MDPAWRSGSDITVLRPEEAELVDLFTLVNSFRPGDPNFRQTEDEVHSYGHADYEHLPTHFVWRLVSAIVRGCRHMHSLGLVRRDLKPENILLTKFTDGDDSMVGDWGIRPPLADFGATMPVNPNRYENPIDFDEMQTRVYAAPEQFVGVPPLIDNGTGRRFGYAMDEKADVFSIAVTVWPLMLLGGLDWNGDAIWQHTDPLRYNRRYKNVLDEDQYLLMWMATLGTESNQPNDGQLHKYWTDECLELVRLIRECLRFHPNNRPTLAQVAGEIQVWLDAHPEHDFVPNTGSDDHDDEGDGGDEGDEGDEGDDDTVENAKSNYWFGQLEPLRLPS